MTLASESHIPAVQLSNVKKLYSSGDEIIYAVNNITLNIEKGQFVIVMGPSGSGKSTLLNVIAGLSNVSEGNIYVNGKSLHSLSENQRALLRRSEIGIVFQFYNLHDGLTAQENIELPMLIAGVPLKERKIRSTELLKLVKIGHRRHHRPYELSGGEKQLVGIARALANNPTIILADEPTGDLDHEKGIAILDLLIRLNRDLQLTIIMVTHDSTLLRKQFRLVRLLDGKISKDQIIIDPSSMQDDFSKLITKE